MTTYNYFKISKKRSTIPCYNRTHINLLSAVWEDIYQTVYRVFCHTGKYLPIQRSIIFAKHFLKSGDLFTTGIE